MKKNFIELKDFFRAYSLEIFIAIMATVILSASLFIVFKVSGIDSKKIYECTVKFQTGEVKTFVCDEIVYNGEFATITVDDIVYKIAYENLEVKIYENTKN